jgi:uncharacterized repeat protein (TIGR02543 family)
MKPRTNRRRQRNVNRTIEPLEPRTLLAMYLVPVSMSGTYRAQGQASATAVTTDWFGVVNGTEDINDGFDQSKTFTTTDFYDARGFTIRHTASSSKSYGSENRLSGDGSSFAELNDLYASARASGAFVGVTSVTIEASTTTTYEIRDHDLPVGSPILVKMNILRTVDKGRYNTSQSDTRSLAISLDGVGDFVPPSRPKYRAEEPWGDPTIYTKYARFFSATVGQRFTVGVSLTVSATLTNGGGGPAGYEFNSVGAGWGFEELVGDLDFKPEWTADGVALTFTVFGQLKNSPNFLLTWADTSGTSHTFADSFYAPSSQAVGDWQTGTTYQLTIHGSQLKPPFHKGYLTVTSSQAYRPDAASRLGDRLWYQSIVDLQILPLSSSPNATGAHATKNEAYEMFATVTNRSPGGVAIPAIDLNLSEFRSQGTTLSKDPNPGLYQATLTVPSLARGQTRRVSLGTFSHNWAWIPDANPIADVLGLFIDAIKGEITDWAVEKAWTRTGLAKLVRATAVKELGGTLLDTLETLDLAANLYLDSEGTNSYRYVLKPPEDVIAVASAEQEVRIDVPTSRKAALAGCLTASFAADFMVGSAASQLFVTAGKSPLGWLQLLAAKGYLDVARLAYETAKDPPDPLYTETVQVERIDAAARGGSQAEQDRVWLLQEIAAYKRAAAKAIDKADGAGLAGDWKWHVVQLRAASDFKAAASRLEHRLGVLQALYPYPIERASEAEIKQLRDSVRSDGLPTEITAGLRSVGFTEADISAVAAEFAALDPARVSGSLLAGGSSASLATQMTVISGFLEGIDLLLQSERFEVTKLGTAVRPIPAQVLGELDADDAVISMLEDADLADDAREAVVDRQLTRLRDLIVTTHNLPILEAYLDRATAARVQLFVRAYGVTDVTAAVDAAASGGDVQADVVAVLKGQLDRVAEAFAAGTQDTKSIAENFAQAVMSRRDDGIAVDFADALAGWAGSVGGKSALVADSYVIEADHLYEFDVLTNDSAAAGGLIRSSLAIADAGAFGDGLTARDGRVRLRSGFMPAGTYVVRYSVLDDATFLRNSQTVSLQVRDPADDDTPPRVTIGSLRTNGTRPTITGTIDDLSATISITLAGRTYSSPNPGTGVWALDGSMLAQPLGEGLYPVSVTATDKAGNVTTVTNASALTIDLTPPTVTVKLQSANSGRPTISGTVNDATATVTITVAGTSYTALNAGDGTWSLPGSSLVAPLGAGAYDVVAMVTDLLGNSSYDTTVAELFVNEPTGGPVQLAFGSWYGSSVVLPPPYVARPYDRISISIVNGSIRTESLTLDDFVLVRNGFVVPWPTSSSGLRPSVSVFDRYAEIDGLASLTADRGTYSIHFTGGATDVLNAPLAAASFTWINSAPVNQVSGPGGWAIGLEPSGSMSWLSISASTVAADGSVVATGIFGGTVDFDPRKDVSFPLVSGPADRNPSGFIARYDTAGSLISAWRIDAPVTALAASANRIVIGGTFTGAGADLDPRAAVTATHDAGAGTAFYIVSVDLATGAPLATSVYRVTPAAGGSGSTWLQDGIDAISATDDGRVYFTGTLVSGTLALGTGAGGSVTVSVPAEQADGFVAALSIDGTAIWAERLKINVTDFSYGVSPARSLVVVPAAGVLALGVNRTAQLGVVPGDVTPVDGEALVIGLDAASGAYRWKSTVATGGVRPDTTLFAITTDGRLHAAANTYPGGLEPGFAQSTFVTLNPVSGGRIGSARDLNALLGNTTVARVGSLVPRANGSVVAAGTIAGTTNIDTRMYLLNLGPITGIDVPTATAVQFPHGGSAVASGGRPDGRFVFHSAISDSDSFPVGIARESRRMILETESGPVVWSILDPFAAYVVTFDAQGGSVSPSNKTVTFGSTYGDLPAPVRAGYTFGGWQLDGGAVTAATEVATAAAHTLSATWTANAYVVTFDVHGGDAVSPLTKNVTFGSTYGDLPAPVRAGFTFGGWQLDGGGVTAGTTVTTAANHTLSATWIANAAVVTLTVSPASVTEDGDSSLVYTFTRTGPTISSLLVNYIVGGTATLGTDYNGISGTGSTKTAYFAAGSTTAIVTLDPAADTAAESDETVILTITPGTGYVIGTTTVTGTITNDDQTSPTAISALPIYTTLPKSPATGTLTRLAVADVFVTDDGLGTNAFPCPARTPRTSRSVPVGPATRCCTSRPAWCSTGPSRPRRA